MNRLTIRRERHTSANGDIYCELEFYIDERRFLDMVREFESSFALTLGGSYTSRYFRDYSEDFLLGQHAEYGERGDKTELLVCECGCPGCWPLAV